MSANSWFWTGALANMAVLLGFAAAGVRQARRGQITRHRRSMLIASSLVVAFLGSFVLKVLFLGREDFATWTALEVNILRVHETCVMLMIIAGIVALVRARRMRRNRQVTRDPTDDPAPAAVVARHRLAGRTALVGAVLGFLTACLVLVGIIGRAA